MEIKMSDVGRTPWSAADALVGFRCTWTAGRGRPAADAGVRPTSGYSNFFDTGVVGRQGLRVFGLSPGLRLGNVVFFIW